jgi:hypothetical protein
MATATVYIWKGHHKAYKMLGAGHAGLKIKTHERFKYYITWYPRGKAVLLKTEANMKLGFAQIREGRDVTPNPSARGQPDALTFSGDKKI